MSGAMAPCRDPMSWRYAKADPTERSTRIISGTLAGPVRRRRSPIVSPVIQRRRYPGPRMLPLNPVQ